MATKTGFIESMSKSIWDHYSDVCEDYKEACSVSLLSTALNRKFIVEGRRGAPLSREWDSEWELPFNKKITAGRHTPLWFILIGDSRISHKTTIINVLTYMLEKYLDENLIIKDIRF